MSELRLVIVPPGSGRWLIGTAAFAGMLAGAVYAAALRYSFPLPGLFPSLLLQLGTPVLLGGAFSAVVSVVVPRRRSVVLLGVIFWVMMGQTAALVLELVNAGEGKYAVDLTSGKLWFSQGLFFLTTIVIGGLVSTLIAFASRTWRTPQEQDGLWCCKCTYRMGPGAITACPECGAPVLPPRYRFAALHKSLNFGRQVGWLGMVLATLVILAFAMATRRGTVEPATLRHAMEKLGPAEGAFFCLPGSNPLNPGPTCEGVRIPLSPPGSLDLIAAFRSVPRAGEPATQLQVSHVLSRRSSRFGVSSMAATLPIPRVLCDLDQKQAAYIAANGVPLSLKNAMLAASAGGSVGCGARARPRPTSE